jgi:hypothetical protein
MSKVIVEKNPSLERLNDLGILKCPTWSKESSTFPWTYSDQETAYILEGEVTVRTENEEPVTFGKGDLVIFPKGLKCIWHVLKPLKKHYKFG